MECFGHVIEEVLEYAEGRRDCVIHGDVERGLSAARGWGVREIDLSPRDLSRCETKEGRTTRGVRCDATYVGGARTVLADVEHRQCVRGRVKAAPQNQQESGPRSTLQLPAQVSVRVPSDLDYRDLC